MHRCKRLSYHPLRTANVFITEAERGKEEQDEWGVNRQTRLDNSPTQQTQGLRKACLTELKDNDTRHLSFNSGEMYWREFLAWNVQELREEHQRLLAFVAAVYILLIDCVGICTGVRASLWRLRNNGGGWRPNSGCQSWWQAPFSTEPFHRPQLPVLVRH